jgi:transmembrane sensor
MPNLEINKLAADWFAKADAGTMTPEEQREFDAWLAADPRHLGAFARHAAAVASVAPLSAIGADEVRRLCDAGVPRLWTRRRVAMAGAGTAALAVAAGFAGLVLLRRDGQDAPGAVARQTTKPPPRYATQIGETRIVALQDGSIVTLNTNSELAVRFKEHVREVHLMRGEALFTVAKNKSRPFIVFAGDTQVRAVGTSFAVRYTQQQPVRILVQEGVVEVKRSGVRLTKPVLAVADTQVTVPDNAPITRRNATYAQVAGGVAWQYGQIFFDNDTLEDAALEFARYSSTRIKIEPSVSHRTITGLFPSDNPIGFAKAAAAALSLHVTVGEDEVQITK